MIGRIYTRRGVLGILGATSLMFALAGCGGAGGSSDGGTTTDTTSTATPTSTPTSTTTSTPTVTPSASDVLVVTPDATEGPFFVDERLNRSDLTGGSADPDVANGLPLTLAIAVYQYVNGTLTPLPNAQVDVWHADTVGVYSDENNGGIQAENTLGQNFLRGYQVTNENGVVNFTTIYPGWYQGRTIHIHFKIRLFNASGNTTYEFTSQWFFQESLNDQVMATSPYNSRGSRSVLNANDRVYNDIGDDGTIIGDDLLLSVNGSTATFNVALEGVG